MLAIEALTPETTGGRVGVVLLGAAILILTLALARRFFSASFFRGFLASVGIFLSFDVVVFHWLFGLHRITSGREANVIEPILVVIGVGFLVYGLGGESRSSASRRPRSSEFGRPDG
jgi:uncharacterized membrane protein